MVVMAIFIVVIVAVLIILVLLAFFVPPCHADHIISGGCVRGSDGQHDDCGGVRNCCVGLLAGTASEHHSLCFCGHLDHGSDIGLCLLSHHGGLSHLHDTGVPCGDGVCHCLHESHLCFLLILGIITGCDDNWQW
jgi:hypothetical protein